MQDSFTRFPGKCFRLCIIPLITRLFIATTVNSQIPHILNSLRCCAARAVGAVFALAACECMASAREVWANGAFSHHILADSAMSLPAPDRADNRSEKRDSSATAPTGTSPKARDLQTTGSVVASAFYGMSDERLKEVLLRDGDVVFFKWKDGRDNRIHVGYSGQEMQKTHPDQVNSDDKNMLAVNYVEVLVEKILRLEKRLRNFEALAKNKENK